MNIARRVSWSKFWRAMLWRTLGLFVGFPRTVGSTSTSSTWAQREIAGRVALAKGRGLGKKVSGVARSTKAFEEPIATHSRECKHLGCRHPIKISAKMIGGREYPNMNHTCLVTNGVVGGLIHHLCSTCQTGRVCKDNVCRGLKCTRSRPDCAHLHDGSGTQRK